MTAYFLPPKPFCIGVSLSNIFCFDGQVGKLLLNALLYPGIKTNSQKNSIVAIFHTAVINIS